MCRKNEDASTRKVQALYGHSMVDMRSRTRRSTALQATNLTTYCASGVRMKNTTISRFSTGQNKMYDNIHENH